MSVMCYSTFLGAILPGCTFNGDYELTHHRIIYNPTSIFWDGIGWDAHWLMFTYLLCVYVFFLTVFTMVFCMFWSCGFHIFRGDLKGPWPGYAFQILELLTCWLWRETWLGASLISLGPPGMKPERWRFQLLAILEGDHDSSQNRDDLVRLLLKIWRAVDSWSEIKRK